MYLYIYDSFLSHQKYASLLAAIEKRVVDLDIRGKIGRLSVLKNTHELISDAVRSGVTTVVAIGDDQTFAKIINIVAPLNITLGLIPVDGNSSIARVLGIPPKELACDVVAARIVKQLDLGKINNYYFLGSAEITNAKVRIACDAYTIAPMTELNTVRISNVGWRNNGTASDPTDGVLEAIITPMTQRWLSKKALQSTVLPFRKIRITADADGGAPILTDEQIILKTPADVEIAPRMLKVIVGSKRLFA